MFLTRILRRKIFKINIDLADKLDIEEDPDGLFEDKGACRKEGDQRETRDYILVL